MKYFHIIQSHLVYSIHFTYLDLLNFCQYSVFNHAFLRSFFLTVHIVAMCIRKEGYCQFSVKIVKYTFLFQTLFYRHATCRCVARAFIEPGRRGRWSRGGYSTFTSKTTSLAQKQDPESAA
jgi:hypothetical protein